MSAPFKMKGSSSLGHGNQHSSSKGMPFASPAKDNDKKEEKSIASSNTDLIKKGAGQVWDKLTQIGEGAKGFVKELARDTRHGETKDPVNEAINSYNNEKANDEGTEPPKEKAKRT